MKLQGRIQVEPLSEERLTNIERGVVAGARVGPPSSHARRPLGFAAAVVAIAAAALVGWKLHDGGAAIVMPAPAPQTLAVSTDAEHSNLVLDGATIASEPGSSFEVTRENGAVIVRLARGKLDLAVEHREGRLFVVRAGDTDVEDIGTKFTVARDSSDDVDVRVREGSVKVKHAGLEVVVAGGQAWRLATGVIAIVDEALVVPAVVTAKEPPLRAHVAVAPPVRVVAPAPGPAPVLGEPVAPASHQAAIEAHADPYVDLKLAIRRQPLAFDPKIDGAGDAAAEIGRLKKIAYSPTTVGDEPSRALYRIAVLLFTPLKQDSEALRTLDMYRRRFATGKELDAVLWLRVRITCGRVIDDECRSAAISYQHEMPNGAGADVALRITNAQ